MSIHDIRRVVIFIYWDCSACNHSDASSLEKKCTNIGTLTQIIVKTHVVYPHITKLENSTGSTTKMARGTLKCLSLLLYGLYCQHPSQKHTGRGWKYGMAWSSLCRHFWAIAATQRRENHVVSSFAFFENDQLTDCALPLKHESIGLRNQTDGLYIFDVLYVQHIPQH